MSASLKLLGHPLAAPADQLAALQKTGAPSFEFKLQENQIPKLTTRTIDVLQVNVGKLCNQVCAHCHVDAGPDRTENMDRKTAETVIQVLDKHNIRTLDLTGGAPELNPQFRWLVKSAKQLGCHVIDRCNLTVLTIRGQRDLVDFLATHEVEVVASLPSFRAVGTDAQRGDGVFDKSMTGLKMLNAAGYGRDGVRRLGLVHNPVGAFLPGSQASLERDYKRELKARFDIDFDQLYVITNMPISRYLEYLERSGNLQTYMQTLVNAFNPQAAQEVMCRNMISVGWDGQVYDCDFNQMLEMPIAKTPTIFDIAEQQDLKRVIRTDLHCYGCTAGAGSSCGGETTS